MSKLHINDKGFSVIEIIIILAILVVVSLVGYFLYSQNTKPKTNTYTGYIFPTLPSAYTLNDKLSPQYSYPSEDYLTSETTKKIIQDSENICKKNGFKLDMVSGNSYISSGSISESNSFNYTVDTVQCNTDNNTWDFNIAEGTALKYQTGIPPLSSNTLSNLSHLNWLDIQSSGPPDYNSSEPAH